MCVCVPSHRDMAENSQMADTSEQVSPDYGQEQKSFKCYFSVVFLCVALAATASEIFSSDNIYFKVVSSKSTWFIYLRIIPYLFDISFAFRVFLFFHCIC